MWKGSTDRVDISGLVMTPLHSYTDNRQLTDDTRPVDLVGSVLRCITTQAPPAGIAVWATLSCSLPVVGNLQFELAGRTLQASDVVGMPGRFLVELQLDPSCRAVVEAIRDLK